MVGDSGGEELNTLRGGEREEVGRVDLVKLSRNGGDLLRDLEA